MSIVGTRPPLISETNLYEPRHKARLAKIKELQLEDSIVLTGNVTNTNEFYQVMDVFILPSFYEGLPVEVLYGTSNESALKLLSNII